MPYKFYLNKNRTGKYINYEIFNKPYGGPRGKAIIALTQCKIKPIKHIYFLYYLKRHFFNYIWDIEWIRFHEFLEGQRRFAVAIINISPNSKAREVIYVKRNLVTINTGWYPLVTGSKARIYLPKIDHQSSSRLKEELKAIDIDEITSISAVEGDGTCINIGFNNGNVILDTGFDSIKKIRNRPKFLFISHFHQDHSGGIHSLLENDRCPPAIMSPTTYNSLWQIISVLNRDDKIKKEKLQKKMSKSAIIIQANEKIILDNGVMITFFPTYHCPGSVGIIIYDKKNKAIIYPGDLCLKNGFLDYSYEIELLLSTQCERSSKVFFLLDATFVNKKYENSPYAQTPQEVLDLLKPGREIPNVWFISLQVETLTYLYLYFFKETRKIYNYPKKLLIDNKLSTLLRSIWTPYAQKTLMDVDPFLKKEFKGEKTNFIESHRVYPLSDHIVKKIPAEENIIAFYSEQHFKKQYVRLSENERTSVFKNSRFYLIGEAAGFEDLRRKIFNLNPLSFEKLASEDWLFHSSQKSIEKFIYDTRKYQNIEILLFHTKLSVLSHFINNMDIQNRKIEIVV